MTEKASGGTMLVSVEQLALVLMVTGVWVRKLCKQGYIPAPTKGKVPLIAGVQGYIKFLKDEDRRSSKSAADNRVRDARAREIELRTAREERELVPTDETVAFVQVIVGAVVSRLDGLPAQITRNLDERRRIEIIVDGIRQEVADVIAEHGERFRRGAPADDADDEDDGEQMGGGK